MANMYQSEHYECECGGDVFSEQVLVQFHPTIQIKKSVTPEELSRPLPALNKTYLYTCVSCGKVINR